MDRLEYKQRLSELETLISEAIASFTCWEALTTEDEELVEALNRFNGFFVPARAAFQQTMLIQAAKAFDRDGRTASFPNLILAARENPTELAERLSHDDFDEIDKERQAIEGVVRRLTTLRNQRLAHVDVTAQEHDSRTVRYGEFQGLLESMKQLFNKLSGSFEGRTVWFDALPREAKRACERVHELVREDWRRARRMIEETRQG